MEGDGVTQVASQNRAFSSGRKGHGSSLQGEAAMVLLLREKRSVFSSGRKGQCSPQGEEPCRAPQCPDRFHNFSPLYHHHSGPSHHHPCSPQGSQGVPFRIHVRSFLSLAQNPPIALSSLRVVDHKALHNLTHTLPHLISSLTLLSTLHPLTLH